ncbi:MAG: ribonuclease P protein component [Spirochaetaceae bacterium]|jgi:ribonuclease P protein component|nr:ribonuclease P protein component [Spirochaetaceae bacterium]
MGEKGRETHTKAEPNGQFFTEDGKKRVRRNFPREERLKSRKDISAVFKKGKKVPVDGALLFYKQNTLKNNRIAFTFAKKFGNAVRRNRARRLGREAYRHVRENIRKGYDLVLLVYPTPGMDFSRRLRQFSAALFRAGLITGEPAQTSLGGSKAQNESDNKPEHGRP